MTAPSIDVRTLLELRTWTAYDIDRARPVRHRLDAYPQAPAFPVEHLH